MVVVFPVVVVILGFFNSYKYVPLDLVFLGMIITIPSLSLLSGVLSLIPMSSNNCLFAPNNSSIDITKWSESFFNVVSVFKVNVKSSYILSTL
mgnify:CR=1 FL=1